MTTSITVVIPTPDVIRVRDLEVGACFLKEERVWIKQLHGYCLALDNFVQYQLRPLEQVERVFTKVEIIPS